MRSPNRLTLSVLVGSALASATLLSQQPLFAPDRSRVDTPWLPPGEAILKLIVRDLDGDGDIDAVYTRAPGQMAYVAINTGGSFAETPFSLPNYPIITALALHDIDLDGDLDILAGGSNSRTTPFSVVENTGAGHFAIPTSSLFMAATEVLEIAPGDLDGDGDIDLLIGTQRHAPSTGAAPYLRYFRNTGNGTFNPSTGAIPAINAAGCRPVLGDFDGDGDLDALVATPNARAIFLDNQLFLVPAPQWTASLTANYTRFQTLDADGDGDLDAVGIRAGTGSIDLLENGGNSFQVTTLSTAPHTDLHVGDVDGDGRTDVIAPTSGAITTFLQRTSSFVEQTSTVRGPLHTLGTLSITDVNGDGRADAVSTWSDSDLHSTISLGGPTGLVARAVRPALTTAMRDFHAMGVGDVTGDGVLDIVTTVDDGTGNVLLSIQENDGKGSFRETLIPTDKAAASIHCVDMDADGDLDIVITSLGQQDRVRMIRNEGRLGWSNGWRGVITRNAIALGDANGDGYPDMIGNAVGPQRVFLNDRTGGIGRWTSLPTLVSGSSRTFVLTDLDGDDDLDIVSGRGQSNCWELLINDGAGAFAILNTCPFPSPYQASSMKAADFDGNGTNDLVMFNTNGPRLLLNDGSAAFTDATGNFPTWVPAGPAHHIQDILVLDVENDGDLDILILRRGQELLYVNSGSGQFSDGTATHWNVPGVTTRYGVAADFDRDGDTDVAIGMVRAINHLRQISSVTPPHLGGTIDLHVALDQGNNTGGFFYGLLTLAQRSSPLAVPGIEGSFRVDATTGGTLPLVVPSIGTGTGLVSLPIPSDPALIGLNVFLQGLTFSPQSGTAFTNVVFERILP